MNNARLAVLPFLLTSCAIRFQAQPDPGHPIERTRVVAASFEDAWSRAVSWFAANNVAIDKIEKSSGLITAKYRFLVSDQAVAGEVTASGLVYGSPEVRRFADLSVLVRPLTAGRTEVIVNLFGTYEATAWWGWLAPNYPVTERGSLASTGKLESSLLDFIEGAATSRSESESSLASNTEGEAGRTTLSSTGTGFFVTSSGYLITNHHVAPEGANVKVLTKFGLLPAKVVRSHAVDDLSLLKVDGQFDPLPVLSSRAVRLGATVATVGFPNVGLQGFAPKLAKGEIAGLSGVMDDPRYFQVSTPIQPGNSGGALVDSKGNVVGVVAARLDQEAALALTGQGTQNVNYAIKSGYLLTFLESSPTILDGLCEVHTEVTSFEEVVSRAEAATVLVLVY